VATGITINNAARKLRNYCI